MKPDFLPEIPYTFIENFYLSCLHPHWHIHHKQPYTMMTFLKISWEKWILVYCIKFYTFLLRLFIYLYICFIKYVAFFHVCLCVCTCVHTHVCVPHHTLGGESTLEVRRHFVIIYSLYYLGSGDWTQVVRHGNKNLCPSSHSASSNLLFLSVFC